MNDAEKEREVLKKGRALHPKFWKLWIMSGQLEERKEVRRGEKNIRFRIKEMSRLFADVDR